jgi:hypothetical protein
MNHNGDQTDEVHSKLFIAAEGDVYLRQMLGEFFTTLAFDNQYGQETLEQAFLPTLRTLFQAPATSPLVQVDSDSVVRLMLNLTRPGISKVWRSLLVPMSFRRTQMTVSQSRQ